MYDSSVYYKYVIIIVEKKIRLSFQISFFVSSAQMDVVFHYWYFNKLYIRVQGVFFGLNVPAPLNYLYNVLFLMQIPKHIIFLKKHQSYSSWENKEPPLLPWQTVIFLWNNYEKVVCFCPGCLRETAVVFGHILIDFVGDGFEIKVFVFVEFK